jgi:hypothetical protein
MKVTGNGESIFHEHNRLEISNDTISRNVNDRLRETILGVGEFPHSLLIS